MSASGDRRARVLIIDDEPRLGVALMRALYDHDVTACTSVEDAIIMLEGGRSFDVVLCDLGLPGMDGVDFFGWVRGNAPALAPKVLFVTGGARNDRTKEFLESPDVRHVEKPFSLDVIRSEIARTLGNGG